MAVMGVTPDHTAVMRDGDELVYANKTIPSRPRLTRTHTPVLQDHAYPSPSSRYTGILLPGDFCNYRLGDYACNITLHYIV